VDFNLAAVLEAAFNSDPGPLAGAKLAGAAFAGATLNGADFRGADLDGADFSGCDLAGARFDGASLRRANFEHASCNGATFRGAKLDQAQFQVCGLERTTWCSASLVKATFGTGTVGQWLPQLFRADFREADLTGASFMGVYAKQVTLDGAVIDGADFRQSGLLYWDLRVKSAVGAKLDGACIDGAVWGQGLANCSFNWLAAGSAPLQGGVPALGSLLIRRTVALGATVKPHHTAPSLVAVKVPNSIELPLFDMLAALVEQQPTVGNKHRIVFVPAAWNPSP